MTSKSRMIWAFAVTSTALFMASLDNLVVTTALPSIREHLHTGLEGLQWTVNAYTLTFAVLLLTGATLGERFGRRPLRSRPASAGWSPRGRYRVWAPRCSSR
jgi:MFS family permease